MSEGRSSPGDPQHQQPDAPVGMPPGLSRRTAIGLMLIPLMHGIGQSLVFAILPSVARDLGISETRVGMVYMLPAAAWSVMTAWWGHRCDIWDRKPILLLSLLGFAISTLIFAGAAAFAYAGVYGATTLWLLILFSRLLYSGMSSGALPAGTSYLIQATPPRKRTASIGRFTASWNLGTLLGPGIIGVLTTFGVLTPLFATAAFAFLLWLPLRRFLDSQHPAPHPSGSRTRLSVLDPRIRSILLIGLCASMAQGTLLQTLGYYFMDRLGIASGDAPRVVGIALMLAAFSTLFSQIVVVGRLQVSPLVLQLVGLGINGAAFTGLILSTSTLHAWLATMLCGMGYGLLRPGNITQASLAVSSHEQGAVAGLNGALWAAGFIITPMFAMPLHAIDPRLPYVAVLGILALAMAGGLRSRHLGKTRIEEASSC